MLKFKNSVCDVNMLEMVGRDSLCPKTCIMGLGSTCILQWSKWGVRIVTSQNLEPAMTRLKIQTLAALKLDTHEIKT